MKSHKNLFLIFIFPIMIAISCSSDKNEDRSEASFLDKKLIQDSKELFSSVLVGEEATNFWEDCFAKQINKSDCQFDSVTHYPIGNKYLFNDSISILVLAKNADDYDAFSQYYKIFKNITNSYESLNIDSACCTSIRKDKMSWSPQKIRFLRNGFKPSREAKQFCIKKRFQDIGPYKVYYSNVTTEDVLSGQSYRTKKSYSDLLFFDSRDSSLTILNVYFFMNNLYSNSSLLFHISDDNLITLFFYQEGIHEGGEDKFYKVSSITINEEGVFHLTPEQNYDYYLPFGFEHPVAKSLPDTLICNNLEIVCKSNSGIEAREYSRYNEKLFETYNELNFAEEIKVQLRSDSVFYLNNGNECSLLYKDLIVKEINRIQYQLPDFGPYECYFSSVKGDTTFGWPSRKDYSRIYSVANLIFYDRAKKVSYVLNIYLRASKNNGDGETLFFNVNAQQEVNLFLMKSKNKASEGSLIYDIISKVSVPTDRELKVIFLNKFIR